MDDCIFCKIISGDIPSYKIYEDENTYAFLDIAKDIDGHTLVVPKKHVRNIFDCDGETIAQVGRALQKICSHYKALGYEGVNILNANEACAQQSVFHLHFHIIPRAEGDGIDAFPKLDKSSHSLEEMCQKLKLD